jgi:hydroxypyruvate reductase
MDDAPSYITCMNVVLSYPKLAGMSYPRLEGTGLISFAASPEELMAFGGADREAVRVLMTSASRGCSESIVDALPNLAFVVSQGAGTELIETDLLAKRGIKLRCIAEALTDDVADLAMALTIMLCRNLLRADQFARSGEWQKSRFDLGDSLVSMTMGIGGLSGRIGQAIAARARMSRMTIAGLDRSSNHGLDATLYPDWAGLAAASDVLVLALPGSLDLKHIIGKPELMALGPRGRLVNVGRGSLVDTNALIEALEGNLIAGAGLDVVEGEPEIPTRLSALPNVILTPHIGGQTWGQRIRAAKIAEDEVLAFINEGQHGKV